MVSVIAPIILLTLLNGLSAFKILSVISTALRSHHVPFQPIWKELALRGHQVTVVTTEPQRNASLNNLKEIDISYCYEIYNNLNLIKIFSSDNSSLFDALNIVVNSTIECENYIFSLPEIQDIMNNTLIKFDLVIIEAIVPSMLALGWKFNCPIIAISTFEPTMLFHDSLGNLVHPLITPDFNFVIEDNTHMNFYERFISFTYIYGYKLIMYYQIYPIFDIHMQKYFGKNLPSLYELQSNVSAMFIGTHPIFHYIRALNLNTIPIGNGLHIHSSQPLPHDLQTFLDDGKNGVIYFSLGSNVNSNLLTDNFKKAIVQAFAEVPYKVLLKMDGELEGVSKNVLVRKWMPQQDILRHKNVKLFITQGGLQSLQEAVVNGVPLIGIPFFGDQITNVNKMVKKGYGLKVNRRTITKEDLVKVINEVMTNPKYRETAEEMGEIFRDEEIPSLQRAVYWTEYVIRHKGAKHLRNPAIGMPTWKYLMLDVLGFLMFIFIAVIVLLYFMIKLLFKFVCYIFRIGKVKKD